jgi:hypothetical protein
VTVEIPRTARLPIEIDVDAELPNGDPAPLTDVQWAITDRSGPTEDTVWHDGTFDPDSRVATAMVCGPQAEDTSNALVLTVPRGRLYALPTQEGASVPGFIDTLELP